MSPLPAAQRSATSALLVPTSTLALALSLTLGLAACSSGGGAGSGASGVSGGTSAASGVSASGVSAVSGAVEQSGSGAQPGSAAQASSDTPQTSTGQHLPAGVSGTVTVFAAASLTESFDTIARQFEAARPGVHVTINYGGSSALATQITQGAPADVFAAASPTTMASVTGAGDASEPVIFATNTLEVAVPKDNPGQVHSLSDLTTPGVKVALCQPSVPCGAVASKVLTAAHLQVKPVTEEADVKGVLTKVALGEVDAGLVYRTDVRAVDGKVTGIPITGAGAGQAVTSYPIAALTTAPNKPAAEAFVAYVRSTEGEKVLTAQGFGAPR